MKTLFITRHAKAIGKGKGPDDFERTLKESGRNEASEVGHHLLKTGLIPQYIVSSPAFRAISTARIIAAEIAYPAELIETDMRIFEGGTDHLLTVIGETNECYNSMMIVGHNPAIDELYQSLSDLSQEEFQKSAVAILRFQSATWKELEKTKGRLLQYITPENSSI